MSALVAAAPILACTRAEPCRPDTLRLSIACSTSSPAIVSALVRIDDESLPQGKTSTLPITCPGEASLEVSISDYKPGRVFDVTLTAMTATGTRQTGPTTAVTLSDSCTANSFDLSIGCDLAQPFGTPAVVSDLPPGAGGIRLSADELTAIYYVKGIGKGDLYRSTRQSVDRPFSAPVPWSELNSPAFDVLPTVPRSNDVVYFERASDDSHVYSASAPSPWGTFSSPVAMALGTSTGEGGPYVTPDGRSLYFDIAEPDGFLDLYHVDLETSLYGAGTPLSGLNTADNESDPVVTPDETTILFASGRSDTSSKGGSDIWIATRTSKTDDFGPATDVAELNTDDDEGPTWISPDGCRLYFDRGTTPYLAERPR